MTGRRPNAPDELERFKTEINLSQVAASFGWTIDTRKTGKSERYVVMRSGRDVIVITRKQGSGHWVFFRSGANGDGAGGSVIDFVQSAQGLNLGQVRAWCRRWSGEDRHVPPAAYVRDLTPSDGNAAAALAEWEAAERIDVHPYLTERGISPEIQLSGRFRGTFRVDVRGNVCLSYVDDAGEICGVEKRNRPARPGLPSWKSYTNGAAKGLWLSRRIPEVQRLVVVESPLDAMAFEQMHGNGHGRYVATGGSYGPAQGEVLTRVIESLIPGLLVMVATDNDAGGHKMGDQITGLLEQVGRTAIRALPRLKDWGDDLKAAVNLSSGERQS